MKKTGGMRETVRMQLNKEKAIWKRFFEFSKFTAEKNKREKCNLDDVEI